ncbi:MAG: hypothetical protein ACE1ZW_01775 [Nitrospirales bacterium]
MKSLVITENYERRTQETPKAWAEAKGGRIVAEVKIDDGIIKVVGLEIQDTKFAKILAEYPENRWCEITRRAVKIGLGFLKGGA